jgi:hypothetical protein
MRKNDKQGRDLQQSPDSADDGDGGEEMARRSSEPEGGKQVKRCFFIAPIGAPGSDVRRRSDQIFKHILEPLCEELGYVALRADRLAEAGMITTQIVEHLINDELVIADLSGHNPNVFYELCLRHVVRKPLVQLIGVGDSIPFDVAGMRTVPLDVRDLDSVADAKQEIMNQIRSFESGKLQLTTPISHAIDWQKLSESTDPEQRTLAELTGMVTALRSEVLTLTRSYGPGSPSETELYEPADVLVAYGEAQRVFSKIPEVTRVDADSRGILVYTTSGTIRRDYPLWIKGIPVHVRTELE